MFDVSIIIPTYNEAKNLPLLVEEIFSSLGADINAELIVVDDNSPDGTGRIAEELSGRFPVRVVHRAGKMGLGSAVIAGFAQSRRPYLGVMDADLSHDPAILTQLIYGLRDSDIAIGSRFNTGSSVENWQWWRKIISKIGVFFAAKLTKVNDPLSGFFFLHRSIVENMQLRTVGYKILLEILVRCKYNAVTEIPFNFRMRKFSTSKLNYTEYILFAGQLFRFSLIKLYEKFFSWFH